MQEQNAGQSFSGVMICPTCEASSSVLRDTHGVQVLQNEVFWFIFGPDVIFTKCLGFFWWKTASTAHSSRPRSIWVGKAQSKNEPKMIQKKVIERPALV